MAKKAAKFTNFTFRFEEESRKRAERLAEEKGWSLGSWVGRLVAREVADLDPRKTRDPITSPASQDPSAA